MPLGECGHVVVGIVVMTAQRDCLPPIKHKPKPADQQDCAVMLQWVLL